MSSIDYHSLVSLPIELWQDEKYLSSATAFYYQGLTGVVLMSNWHVFSGRDANSSQPLHAQGAIPNIMKLHSHTDRLGATKQIEFSIYEDEKPKWQQHPLGQAIDIACVRLTDWPVGIKTYFPTHGNSSNSLRRSVGSECYIVGFPVFNRERLNYPIWKRGSIASEYTVGYDAKDCFIVDSTTSTGMSGSPVYLRQYGNAVNDEGTFTTQIGPQTNFVGIYSGRMTSSKEGALSLGYVWKQSLIDEMLHNPTAGSYELHK